MTVSRREPETIQWTDARQRILDAAAKLAASKTASGSISDARKNKIVADATVSNRDRVVIGITGPVGAGKSTLAAQLSDCVIGTDHYFPNYDVTPTHLRDLPESSDLPRLANDLAALRRGEAATIPVWSFVSHAREEYRRVEPARTIVCEGLHALHEIPRPHIDIAVYVDAPATVRWSRWEALERSGVRQLGVEAARQFFHEFAEPIYEQFRHGYKSAAHFVVINDSSAS